jgi:peptidoglycan hydrolase CwlO-like protein
MEIMFWNAALTVFMAILGWALRTKEKELETLKEEQQRIQILLNRTREEVAKEYVTKVEVHSDINRVLDRLDRLEGKIDRIMEAKNG